MNGLTLAYIGDAYYELKVRMHLINQDLTKVDALHKKAIRFTSAVAQASIVDWMMSQSLLSEDEIELFKRGRNVSGPGRKNVDAKTYHHATGFESLIGYLSIHHETRANELIIKAIEYIEKGDFNGKNSQ